MTASTTVPHPFNLSRSYPASWIKNSWTASTMSGKTTGWIFSRLVSTDSFLFTSIF
jgi:hypothetical protein